MKHFFRPSLVCMVIAVLLGYQNLNAQQISDVKQRHDDKKGVVAAAAGVADDRRDLDRLSDLIMRWDHLMQQNRDSARLQQVEDQIALELRRDLWESATQAKSADREVKQSAAEVAGSRREVRREARDGDHNRAALRDDRRDLRDDRRDLRDDKRDANKVEEILVRKREIAKALIVLQQRIDADKSADPVLQARKRELFGEYLALSREEIKLGVREVREDVRELREDRRETREDRKQ